MENNELLKKIEANTSRLAENSAFHTWAIIVMSSFVGFLVALALQYMSIIGPIR